MGGGCGGGHQSSMSHEDQTAAQWEKAFWRALLELQTDAVKAKIKAAWGKKIDQTASAVVDLMLQEWKAFHESDEARQSFREKLRKSFEP
jgi:hypothetical protein